MPSGTLEIDAIDFVQHAGRYLSGAALPPAMLHAPVKAMRLSEIRDHLQSPTPQFKPQYTIIVLLTAGKVQARVDFERLTAEKNSALFMLSNKLVAREHLSADLEGFGLIIEDSALPALLSGTDIHALFKVHPLVALAPEDATSLAAICAILASESNSIRANSAFMQALAQAVLHKLLECAKTAAPATRAEEIAFGYKQLVYRHFLEEHSVAFYAAQLAVSESYLNRCVKSVFRRSSKQIWCEVIISYSRVILQDRSRSVSEIAYGLNFADPSYFSRLFKGVNGLSPTEFREGPLHDLSGHLPAR